MDTAWVNRWLDSLEILIERLPITWTLFDPTPTFYVALEDSEDRSLVATVSQIGRHLDLKVLPSATYEWSLRMEGNVAGQIHFGGHTPSQIHIPLVYVGNAFALGGILAHELTHEFLNRRGIHFANADELELVTDLASIALGLGKLFLNGTVLKGAADQNHTLGYLNPRLKAYSFREVNRRHMVRENVAAENLCIEALTLYGQAI